MAKKKEENNIKAKYKFPDNYNPLFINGLYGGWQPNGEMVIHFYQERWSIPNSHTLDENGIPLKGATDPVDLNNIVIRYVQSGITLNKGTAVSLRNWLNKFLDDSDDADKN